MMKSVRIIKRSKDETLTGLQLDQDEMTEQQSTREIVTIVKGWISELHQRRRAEQLASSAFRKARVTVSLLILSFWGLGTESYGQQLREAFRRVERQL